MVLTWCKAIARVICGQLRTEAQPEPPLTWRGEPLAAADKPTPSPDPFRTLIRDPVPDGPTNSPTTGSSPLPPATDPAEARGSP
jgi:hypothetical protein